MLPEKVVHLATGAEHACAATVSGRGLLLGRAGGRPAGQRPGPGHGPEPAPAGADGERHRAGGRRERPHLRAGPRRRRWSAGGCPTTARRASPPGPTPVSPAPVAGLTDVAALAIGGDHACAITSDRGVVVLGPRRLGAARASAPPRGWPSRWPSRSFGPVSAVSAAGGHTCAVAGGAAFCWGAGRFGQLGAGTTGNINKPTAVMKLAAGVVAIEGGRSPQLRAARRRHRPVLGQQPVRPARQRRPAGARHARPGRARVSMTTGDGDSGAKTDRPEKTRPEHRPMPAASTPAHLCAYLVLCGERPLLGGMAFDLSGVSEVVLGRGGPLAASAVGAGRARIDVPDGDHVGRARPPGPGRRRQRPSSRTWARATAPAWAGSRSSGRSCATATGSWSGAAPSWSGG